MADVGIRISKPFQDVLLSGEADMLFSSSWPSLPIAAQQTYTSPGTDLTVPVVFEHNLGFVPLVAIWQVVGGKASRVKTTSVNRVSSSYVSIPATSADSVTVICYNIDIATEIEYPFVTPSAVESTYSPDYGIKIVKDGRDIDSNDMRDFILHSRCQSPQILAVKTQESGNPVEYAEPQGYTSWVFGFVRKADGSYYYAPYYSQGYPRTLIEGTSPNITYSLEYIEGFGDTGASIVILRDPMFAPINVSASY